MALNNQGTGATQQLADYSRRNQECFSPIPGEMSGVITHPQELSSCLNSEVIAHFHIVCTKTQKAIYHQKGITHPHNLVCCWNPNLSGESTSAALAVPLS